MKKTLSKKGTLVVLILEGEIPFFYRRSRKMKLGKKGRWWEMGIWWASIGLKKINLFIIFICLSIALPTTSFRF
jgi:hypothetical protein